MIRYIMIFLIVTFLSSCQSSKEESLQWALRQAGDNLSELEAVLTHYKTKKADSLKYRAALFLITNMPGHYSYRGDSILRYYEDIIPILDCKIDVKEKKDSIEKIAKLYSGLEQYLVEDIQIITSDYLIKNIDQAFELWHKPWASHLSFEQFCEYLLPYKYAELQILDAWRDTLSTKFCDALYNMPEGHELSGSTFHIAQTINTNIRHNVKIASLYGLGTFNGYDFLSAGTIHKIPFGLCPDYVALGVLALRSHGIPVIAEYTPIWGRSNTGHSWYSILNDDGSHQPSQYDISSYFGTTLFPEKKMPKIYRKTYARNPTTAKYLQEANHIHPSIELFQKDVTDKYIATGNVTIPLFDNDLPDQYAYIATFDEEIWRPVDYGKIKKNKALFKNMGRDILYITLSYDGMKMHPISHPFIIHKNGQVEYIVADTSQLQAVELWRKYPRSYHIAEMERRILGGKIQAANKQDFSDSVTCYTINTLHFPDRIPLNNTEAYRYWRYYAPPESYGNIAELLFFNKENKEIRGTILGTPGDDINEIAKVFDDNWLTCYDTWTKDIPWVGMDFKEPVQIDKVRCVPRTDDNCIHFGDEYELKYWDQSCWQSLGIQTANNRWINYNNVPKNALLWLSNLTRGNQERLFLYKNGQIEWW